MPPVRTLIFDLGQTLIPFSLARLEPRLAGCREPALELCRRFEAGGLTPESFQAEMCGLTGLGAEEFAPWWNAIFEPRWLIPPQRLRALMRRYRTGLLSNTNPLHFAYLEERWPLLGAFDFHVLSHEVGAAKPDARIYQAAEAAAGCAPDEILYLDDVPEFVAAARGRGWQAEVFTGAASLESALGTAAGARGSCR
jgi:FMN phosphatase YigB (HAD superfamily)